MCLSQGKSISPFYYKWSSLGISRDFFYLNKKENNFHIIQDFSFRSEHKRKLIFDNSER